MRERRPSLEGRRGVEDKEEEAEFLDSDEQANLIAELRRKGIHQSLSTRRLFQALSIALLLALFYCTSMALTMPFLLEHQNHFKASVSPLGFVMTYLVDIICILISISIFQGRRDTFLLTVGFGLGVLNLLYWASIFAQETPFPGIGFWWLPMTSLFIVMIALYVDHDLRRLIQDIDVLEKMKYSYKKV